MLAHLDLGLILRHRAVSRVVYPLIVSSVNQFRLLDGNTHTRLGKQTTHDKRIK